MVVIGIAGASASGKTTVLRSLTTLVGRGNAAHLDLDGYHLHSREERQLLCEYPEDPSANDLCRAGRDLEHLLGGRTVSMPVYDHKAGAFTRPKVLSPRPILFVEGLHAGLLNGRARRQLVDYTVFVNPREDLRLAWKVNRDVNDRGYSYADATGQIALREPYVRKYVRPQRDSASVVALVEMTSSRTQSHRVFVTPRFYQQLRRCGADDVLAASRSRFGRKLYVEIHAARRSVDAVRTLRRSLNLAPAQAPQRMASSRLRKHSYSEMVYVLFLVVLLSIRSKQHDERN
jgi:phosphoribulokinase